MDIGEGQTIGIGRKLRSGFTQSTLYLLKGLFGDIHIGDHLMSSLA